MCNVFVFTMNQNKNSSNITRGRLYIDLNPKKKVPPATIHAKRRAPQRVTNILKFVLPKDDSVELLLPDFPRKPKKHRQ